MRRSRTQGGERGASIVELALISPVMVLLTFGVLDLSRAYRMNIRLENAAREGASFAQMHPNHVTCGSYGNIRDQIVAEEIGVSGSPDFVFEVLGQDASKAWVPLTGCSGTEAVPGERVRVEVRARYDVRTPIVANAVGGSITLEGEAEVRVQGRVGS